MRHAATAGTPPSTRFVDADAEPPRTDAEDARPGRRSPPPDLTCRRAASLFSSRTVSPVCRPTGFPTTPLLPPVGGRVVAAPFGSRLLTGIVASLDPPPAPEGTEEREIVASLDEAPFLPELARPGPRPRRGVLPRPSGRASPRGGPGTPSRRRRRGLRARGRGRRLRSRPRRGTGRSSRIFSRMARPGWTPSRRASDEPASRPR